jgi:protoporphyrinogen oxidase
MKRGIVIALAIGSLFLSFCSRYSTQNLPDKGIAILSPKANDVVQAGASYEIQWKAEDSDPEFGAVVTVEFSKDGGKSWEQVEENVSKAGKYLWKVPKIESTQCKIRVFAQGKPEYRGTSGVFAVK